MILVDTSVWIDHLRSGVPALVQLLEQNSALMHPMVLGELACGNLKNRQQLLRLWHNLVSVQVATHDEALYFIDQNVLSGQGIGYIDVHLLASASLTSEVQLWTRDKRLANIAIDLHVGWEEIAEP